MVEAKFATFEKLGGVVCDQEKRYIAGIPTRTIESLMPRSNGGSVFEEGKLFGAFIENGEAEACLTTVASPYVAPNIDRQTYISAVSESIHAQSLLPESLAKAEKLPPQIALWFRQKQNQNVDLSCIHTLPPTQKAELIDTISHLSEKALCALQSMTSQRAAIIGSVGHTSTQERQKSGFNRGCPTTPVGHVHFLVTQSDSTPTIQNDHLNPSQKLNFYAPWSVLFNQEFGGETAKIIKNRFANLGTQSDHIHVDCSDLAYQISFSEGLSVPDTYRGLIDILGTSEMFYQELLSQYSQYHGADTDMSRQHIEQTLSAIAVKYGYTHEAAIKLRDMVLSIRPTFAQLSTWANDPSKIARYERINQKLTEKKSKKLSHKLVGDALKNPTYQTDIDTTWSGHLSASYIVDQWAEKNGEIRIHSIKLYPAFVTVESAVQRTFGSLLLRALS